MSEIRNNENHNCLRMNFENNNKKKNDYCSYVYTITVTSVNQAVPCKNFQFMRRNETKHKKSHFSRFNLQVPLHTPFNRFTHNRSAM